MRTEKEIKDCLATWKKLQKDLTKCGDTVSLIVVDHAELYIKTLEWVLGKDVKVN